MSSSERILAALASLGSANAPVELEARVALELAGDRSYRLQRVLNSLVRHGAPALLDRRVAASFGSDPARGDEQRGSQKAQALRALDVHSAPDVLERLLQEELAAPERHRAERFSGSMERLPAPAALAERLEAGVRRRAFGRLVFGPLATLVAAGLVIWLAGRGEETAPRRYRFEVTQATSLDDLDPLARILAESLGGGVGVIRGEPR